MGVAIAFALARVVSGEKNALPELSRGPWGILLPLGGWPDRQYWFSCYKSCVLKLASADISRYLVKLNREGLIVLSDFYSIVKVCVDLYDVSHLGAVNSQFVFEI